MCRGDLGGDTVDVGIALECALYVSHLCSILMLMTTQNRAKSYWRIKQEPRSGISKEWKNYDEKQQ